MGLVGSPCRELGIRIGELRPGPNDAITDVPGVRVGHATVIAGEGPLIVGQGPVRTGVTVIMPHDGSVGEEPLFAGCHRLNGNGELTGLEWVRESGMLMSPIAITNTHSVGTVRDALIAHQVGQRPKGPIFWSLPVVGETWDGTLNDINGFHVKAEHVDAALSHASDGLVEQGNVGGGTGMICHDFKGGIGTASRVLTEADGGYTVGVLVQANHGRRHRLTINGVAVGRRIDTNEAPAPRLPEPERSHSATSSIIIVVATDAPLLPHQCDRLAQRAGLGVARTGGVGEHSSGDLFFCFSVANRGMSPSKRVGGAKLTSSVEVLSDLYITPLFDAVVEATEEAIVNALLAAETMVGRDGVTAHALKGGRLLELLS